MGTRVKLGARGTVTIPKKVRWNLAGGEEFEVGRRPDGVIELRPSEERDPAQAWFWTERWQAMEREVDEQIARGEGTVHDSIEEMFAYLDRK